MGDKPQQNRAVPLLAMTDDRMIATLQKDRHIKLVPRSWWPEKTHTLEPQDPGWWYTVSEEVKFNNTP